MSQDQDSFINSLRELNSKCEDPTVNQYVRASISILCCLIVVMLLANLRILILRAQRGDMEAANEMLLPGYWWLVIGFAFTYLLDAAYLLVWDLNGVGVVCRDGDSIDCSTLAILAGLELACRRFVIDGVAVFFMHYGAGQRALRSTVCIVAPWALFVGFVEFLWNQRPNDDDAGNHYENNPASSNFWTAHNTAPNFNALSLGLEITYASLMVIFYGSLAFFPPHVVYRRPALGNWYIGWQLVTMILINVDVVVVSAMHYSYGSCVYYISFTFLEVLVGPFILWGTLKDDSKYWQGLLFVDDDTNVSSSHWSNFAGCVDSLFRCARNGTSQSTGTNSSNTSPLLDAPSSPEDHYRRTSSTYPSTANNTSQTSAPQHVTLTQPLLGQSLMTDAAQELASTMELLSETPNVEFLHFGLLSIETILAYDHPSAFVLGAGGAAKVYKGRLRGEPVAIKMIWSVDITAEIVAQFREEVIMLAKLARHPSVVQLKGYSVMPPALCVVMELCSKGSLLELLEGIRNDAASAEEATRFRRKATLLRQEYERQPLNSPRKSDGSYSDINAVSGMQQLVGGNETVANHGSFGAGNAENVGTMSRPRYSSAGSNSSDVSTVLVALEQTWPARLQMACECAEAVAFLHLQKPPVMHKDIKSSNFLVVENSAPPGGWNSSWVYKSAPAAALSVSARSLSSLFSSNGSNSRSGASENQGVQKKWRYEIRLSDLGSAVESLVELAQSDANSTRSDSHVGDVNSPLVGGLNAPRVSLNGAGLEPEKRERFGSGSNGGSLITGPRRHGRRPPIPRRGSGSGWGSSADGSERARSSCTGERQSMDFSGHEGPRQHYSFGASPRTATSTAAGAALVGGGNIRYSESSVGSATRGTMNGLAGWVPGATGTVTPPRRRHSDVSRESLGGLEYDENKVYELQGSVTPNWAAPEVLASIISVRARTGDDPVARFSFRHSVNSGDAPPATAALGGTEDSQESPMSFADGLGAPFFSPNVKGNGLHSAVSLTVADAPLTAATGSSVDGVNNDGMLPPSGPEPATPKTGHPTTAPPTSAPPQNSSTPTSARSATSSSASSRAASRPFKDPYTTAADVYSLGIVLWELFACQTPFDDAGFMELVKRVGRDGETPPLPSNCPPKYASLLRACWRRDPQQRPSALKVVDTLRAIQGDLESENVQDSHV